jgi:hypothetical protein
VVSLLRTQYMMYIEDVVERYYDRTCTYLNIEKRNKQRATRRAFTLPMS